MVLWYIHVLACLVGLAYLPFSKMFHIFASPVSLLANGVIGKEKLAPANRATLQAMELDACTHCGTCSLRCSVIMAFEEITNINIFPSEKIASIKALASGKELRPQELRHIQEGVYLCSNCYRCTVVCPSGINLQDLWFNVRETLLQKGYPEFLVLSPLSFYRGLMKEETVQRDYEKPLIQAREAISAQCDLMKKKDQVLPLTPTDRKLQSGLNLSAQAKTFSVCFGCQTCTTVCPVVGNYENPQEVLGLLPHQIMHAAGLGLRDLAFGSNMLWDCLTCYQCQEQCPQGVHVTDVLYELKNLAVKQVREKTLQPMERK
jgi:heterodisulfide reductase subunit C